MLNWAGIHMRVRWAYDGEVLPRYRVLQSDHANCYLAWLVRSGDVTVRQGEHKWRVRPGQWFVSPRGVTEQILSADTRLLSVNVLCQWITGRNLFAQADGLLFDAAAFPELEIKAVALSRLIESHIPDANSSLEFQPATYRVFLKFQQAAMDWMETFIGVMLAHGWAYAHAGKADERAIRAANILSTAPLHEPVPWPMLLEQTGLERTHLERLFNEEFNQTMVNIWNQRRLRSARHALAATAMPLKELSQRLGFSQPSHFTRWFKSQTDLPPRDYRLHHGSATIPQNNAS